MVVIKATGFGWIETSAGRFDTDILVYPDERIEGRYTYQVADSHTIDLAEVRRVLTDIQAVLVIGSGQSGWARLSESALEFLQKNGIEFHIATTPKAIKVYNQIPAPKAGIFHITC